jgi:hypothetical protein
MLKDEYSSHAKSTKTRKGGASYTIAEECERLFCEQLEVAFLGERIALGQDSLVMGANKAWKNESSYPQKWLEVWDYRGDLTFRGFVVEKNGGRSLFIFFEAAVAGKDLKPG